MERFWEKCKRQKLMGDEQLYHSECQRSLGLCSLLVIGSVLILPTILFSILPSVFTVSSLHSPPLASVILSGVLIKLSASQFQSISRTTPKTALLYNFAYVLNSEVLAFLIAWSQFLDGNCLTAILLQTLSDHISLLFNATSNFEVRINLNFADLFHLRIDAIVLIGVWFGAAIMCCSFRVLTTLSIVFLVSCLFTSTSTSVVALLHNIAHLKINYIDFPYSFDEVFHGSCWFLIVILCIELLTFTSDETEHPRKVLPLIFGAMSKVSIVLIFFSVIAYFPFGYRKPYTHDSLLPAAFNTIGIFSARYLMNVGSVCGLCAASLTSILYGSRLLCALSNDRLLPGFVSLTFGKRGTCRIAVVFTALFVSFISIVPRQTLCQLLPLNICLRLICQAFLVYKSCFLPEHEELNRVPTYDQILPSNRSSMVGEQSILDENYSFSSSDDEEDDLLMDRLWKINGNECESSFSETQVEKEDLLSSDSTAKIDSDKQSDNSSVAIQLAASKLNKHNCLISSCAENQSTQKWPRFHIYESEYIEPASVVLRKSKANEIDTEKVRKKAMQYIVYFAFLSSLTAISHKILRQKREYVPILPLATLVTSLFLMLWIFVSIYLSRRKTDFDKGRYLPCECLCSVFLLAQFVLNFSLFNYLTELVWLLIGFILYVLISLKHI